MAIRSALRGRKIGSLLDVGCGNGRMTREICRSIPSVTAVDSSPRAVEQAKQALADRLSNGSAVVMNGSLSTLGPTLGTFDAVMSLMVCEHIPDDVEYVRSLTRYLRRGGAIVVAVPSGRDRWTIEDDLVGHLRRYDRASLGKLFAASGIEDVSYFAVGFPLMNITEWVRNRILARRLRFNSLVEVERRSLPIEQQTQVSGIWNSIWVNAFPIWISLMINRVTMRPLHWVSIMGNRSHRETVLLAIGTKSGDL